MRRPNDCEGSRAFILKELARSHVDELDIAVFVDDYVLGFEVSVEDLLGVQVLQRKHHRGYVELGVFGGQQTDITDHVEELQSVDEFGQEIHKAIVFEGAAVL